MKRRRPAYWQHPLGSPCPSHCPFCGPQDGERRSYSTHVIVAHACRYLVEAQGGHPSDYNFGGCIDFAKDLVRMLRRGKMVWSDEVGHAAYFTAGLYFDSEEIYGVRRIEDLPFYRRAQDPHYCRRIPFNGSR